MKLFKKIVSLLILATLSITICATVLNYCYKRYWLDHLESSLDQTIVTVISRSDHGDHSKEELSVSTLESEYKFKLILPKNPKRVLILYPGLFSGNKIDILESDTLYDSAILAISYPLPSTDKHYRLTNLGQMIGSFRRSILSLNIAAKASIKFISERNDLEDLPLYSLGASLGSLFSYQLAAIEPRVSGTISLLGFSSLFQTAKEVLSYETDNKLLTITLSTFYSLAFSPLDPWQWVKRNQNLSLLFIDAKDESILSSSDKKKFRQAHNKKTEIVLAGDHFDFFKESQQEKVRDAIYEWILAVEK